MNTDVINSETQSWSQYAKGLVSKAKKLHIPISGTFELSPKCNLKCKMCYVRLTDSQMASIGKLRTADEWINMGKQAADAGSLFLLLTGGEPFLRSDFRQIYEALSRMGFLISIFSNGTLISEEIVEWLVKLPPAEIRITLYGASNDTYEKVCGEPNGFDKVINAIKLLRGAGFEVHLSSTIIRENLEDVPQLNQLAKELGLYIAHNPNVVGEVRGASGDAKQSRLSAQQIQELIKGVGFRTEALCSTEGSFGSKCNMVNCGYWITWDGKMSVCSFMNKPYTLPFENGFEPAWQELVSLASNINEPKKCNNCSYKAFCLNCPGMLTAETGSYKEVSDRNCELARVLFKQYSVKPAK